jgi:hypothetical protein
MGTIANGSARRRILAIGTCAGFGLQPCADGAARLAMPAKFGVQVRVDEYLVAKFVHVAEGGNTQ